MLYQIYGTPNGQVWPGPVCPLRTWTHFCGTYDGSCLRMFKDGKEVGTVPYSGTPHTSEHPLQLGYGDIHDKFRGDLTGVAVFDKCLDQESITEMMQLTTPVSGNDQ